MRIRINKKISLYVLITNRAHLLIVGSRERHDEIMNSDCRNNEISPATALARSGVCNKLTWINRVK